MILYNDKDNPLIISKLQQEIPCMEIADQSREATYKAAAEQYRCSIKIPTGAAQAEDLLFLNLNTANTLESVVIYQFIPFKALIAQSADSAEMAYLPALFALYSDILSRIDNVRAPSGSYVEYGRERQKFAVRFK